jgi:hypothetical protein
MDHWLALQGCGRRVQGRLCRNASLIVLDNLWPRWFHSHRSDLAERSTGDRRLAWVGLPLLIGVQYRLMEMVFHKLGRIE